MKGQDARSGRSGKRWHPLRASVHREPDHKYFAQALSPGVAEFTRSDWISWLQSPASPTLAELLRKQRYHTAAFIGAVILDSKTLAPGFDQGFDFYDNFPSIQPRNRDGDALNAGGWKWCGTRRRG